MQRDKGPWAQTGRQRGARRSPVRAEQYPTRSKIYKGIMGKRVCSSLAEGWPGGQRDARGASGFKYNGLAQCGPLGPRDGFDAQSVAGRRGPLYRKAAMGITPRKEDAHEPCRPGSWEGVDGAGIGGGAGRAVEATCRSRALSSGAWRQRCGEAEDRRRPPIGIATTPRGRGTVQANGDTRGQSESSLAWLLARFLQRPNGLQAASHTVPPAIWLRFTSIITPVPTVAAILALGSSNTSPRSRVVSEPATGAQTAVSLSSEVVLRPDSPPHHCCGLDECLAPYAHGTLASCVLRLASCASRDALSQHSQARFPQQHIAVAAPGIASFQARLAPRTPPRSCSGIQTCELALPCMTVRRQFQSGVEDPPEHLNITLHSTMCSSTAAFHPPAEPQSQLLP
ncbi:uncharacterized protein BDZ99DRAFT_553062 [Mytilinidion resinicola]|uniref:Uncharacterized protein n=1 Tax=Mytilinidion resinicola TaxID=574789 RepID=A0A6A6XYT7_9PEZI|nr:uncharacterized protein BDZ99DRAFT_553062 [Mytilinidion resinicola]KAF2801580.1 hypothetical protein BDZ99DRAFT_553062 [Mytilinidion resinicola]